MIGDAISQIMPGRPGSHPPACRAGAEGEGEMTDADDEGDKLARSFLESQRLNRVADYVSRGRKFSALTIDAVEDGWRASHESNEPCAVRAGAP